jgi:hypothetical protein
LFEVTSKKTCWHHQPKENEERKRFSFYYGQKPYFD